MSRVVRVPFEGDVIIEINDEDVIERWTGPEGDELRALLYPLRTEADVLVHLAYNALMNNVSDPADLDGWGDWDHEAKGGPGARMYVDHTSLVIGE